MDESANSNVKQFVVFKLGKEEYGFDIQRVTIIERMMKITRVPKTPPYIKGVINLRGEIIPIMDLRERFRMPSAIETDDTRIVIIKIDEVSLGLIVDEIMQTLQLTEDSIENITNLGEHAFVDYIIGVGKHEGRIITLLNPEKILSLAD